MPPEDSAADRLREAPSSTGRGGAKRFLLVLGFLLLPIVGSAVLVGALAGLGPMMVTAGVLLLGALLVLAIWLVARLTRAFLWRVGRRLAFSYFLIGVLPIPMAVLLVGLNGYLLAGYFLGHLYRDARTGIATEVARAASAERLAATPGSRAAGGAAPEGVAVARYRDGRRTGGDERFPDGWPAWLAESDEAYVALPDGTPTIAATAGDADAGVVALLDRPVAEELSRRSEVWIELFRSDDPEVESVIRLDLLGQEYALLPLTAKRIGGRHEFFGIPEEGAPLRDRPLLWWGEIAGSLRSLENGRPLADYVMASLNGNLALVSRHLFSGSAEVDTAIWAATISLTVVLASIYAGAVAMALWIIFTLSRAVNRLSQATNAVRSGDFSTRIPVKRHDQIGELQRSFNLMTANLEQLVAAEAQKEILEKELEIARDLQTSLLPQDLPSDEALDFATLFEPSAAIGGDYFDVLRIDDSRLAVVIADVSGHGLPAGLRMAMLKASLVILVEEAKAPEEILSRLDVMIRSERRIFVTATLGTFDRRSGRLELTNAGHPPTYLIHRGEVEEILLPGHPLGTLGESYGRRILDLEPGDAVVWLSDGLIEATNADGEPFGYERIRRTLSGPLDSAADLRDRLVAAVAAHTDGRPVEDDRTLVAMHFQGRAGLASSGQASSPGPDTRGSA